MDRAALCAGSADPRLPHLTRPRAFPQCALERGQLIPRLGGRPHLFLDELGPLAPEPLKLDHEAPDVPQLKLTQLAQVPRAAPHLAALGWSCTHGGSMTHGEPCPSG